MAVAGSARFSIAATAAIPSPSVAHSSDLAVTFSHLTDIANFAVGVYRSAGAPATFGAATQVAAVDPLTANTLNFHETDGGSFYAGQLTSTIPAAGGAIGNNVWVALFEHTLAFLGGAPGTAPDLVLGPFVEVA